MGKKYIGLDLGASKGRVRNLDQDNVVHKLDNNVQVIDLEANTGILDIGKDLINSLDLTIVKDGVDDSHPLMKVFKEMPLRVLVGDIATRFGQGRSANELPDALANKMQQRVNWVNMITGIVYSHLMANEYTKGISQDIGDISLVLALPPGEVEHNRNTIIENLKGSYSVRLNLFDIDITFNIVDVNLVYESSMAILSYLYSTSDRRIDGTVLSIDIGASTTDLLLVEDSRVNDSTTATLKSGCNLIRESASTKFSGVGINLKDDRLNRAIYEGRYKSGTTYRDCSALIQEAKKEASNEVLSEIMKYFNKHRLDVSMLDGILITGGGSLKGGYLDDKGNFVETSDSLGNYLLEAIESRFGNLPEVLEYVGNPRDANITGIYYKLKVLELQSKGK